MRVYIKIKKFPLFVYVPNRLGLKYLGKKDPENAQLYLGLRKAVRKYRGWTLLEVICPSEEVYIRVKL